MRTRKLLRRRNRHRIGFAHQEDAFPQVRVRQYCQALNDVRKQRSLVKNAIVVLFNTGVAARQDKASQRRMREVVMVIGMYTF